MPTRAAGAAPGTPLPARRPASQARHVDTLRFYLNGESSVVNTLYELLCANLLRVVIRDPAPNTRVAR